LSGLAEAALTGMCPGCAFTGRRVTISSSVSSELAASPLLPLPAFPAVVSSCCCCLLRLRGGLLRSIPVSSSLDGGRAATLLLQLLLLLLSLTVDSRERFACGSRIRTPGCGCDLTARLLLTARGEGREGRPSSESSVPPRGSMTCGMVLT
jgi:hypothetical protein